MPDTTFFSPASPTSPLPTSVSEAPAPQVSESSRELVPDALRVLIVESDVSCADELNTLLEGEGFATEIAADAKTSLLALQEFKPHLVLLGTYLADMPGYELTAILRSAPQYTAQFQRTGLLFIADREKIVRHRLIGAPTVPMTQYIFKPINAAEVHDKVHRELAKFQNA